MSELFRYCENRTDGPIAPGSVERILRDLRQHGVVNVDMVGRRRSLYQVNAEE